MESKMQAIQIEAEYLTDITADVTATEECINSLKAKFPVLVFSKITCSFCIEMKRTLVSYGVTAAIVEVDKLPGVKSVLSDIFSMKTFPILVIDGNCIGGCSELKSIEHGSLPGLILPLLPYMTKYPTVFSEDIMDRVQTAKSFFWFPDTVNNNPSRLASGFGSIICLLCIAFRGLWVTPWVTLALAVDYLLRFIFGGDISLLAMIGAVLTARLEPDFRTGPQKQFAAGIGLFFAIFGAGFYLAGEDYRDAGAVLLGVLMGAAALEFVFDICLGCIIFGWLIDWGLVSTSINQASINLVNDKKCSWNFAFNDKNVYPPAFNQRYMCEGQPSPLEIDLVRKERDETEYKNNDFHLIKHTKVEYFGMPMGIAALALVYKELAVNLKWYDWELFQVSNVLGLTSLATFFIFASLYIARFILYPKKVWKEWMHPSSSSFFSALSITICIYGLLMMTYDRYFAISIIWISAVFQMFLSVVIISRLVFEHISDENISPSILMAPVGNFIAAIALGRYPFDEKTGQQVIEDFDVNYVNIARLFYSVALLFTGVMFTITFKKTFGDTHSDNRIRPSIYIWQASAAAAGLAYLIVCDNSSSGGKGLFFHFFYWITIFLFFVNIIGWVKGFYVIPADMSFWIYAFSNDLLASICISYYIYQRDLVSFIAVCFSVAIASYTSGLCFMHSLFRAFDGTMFLPKQKWGPMSIFKLQHESFRYSIPKFIEALKVLDPSWTFAVEQLAEDMLEFFTVYDNHSKHEDDIVFPEVNSYFPGVDKLVKTEHEEMDAKSAKLEDLLKLIKESPSSNSAATALQTLKDEFPLWGDEFLKHLRDEENSVTRVLRKYTSVERTKELFLKVWEDTSSDDWHIIIPFTLKNLPNPVWKSRFVRAFIWVMPEMAQEIGAIIYRGCDSVLYASLADEIPEMIPRNCRGFRKKW